MNGSAAKASRRDLRRALGSVAVETLPAHAQRLDQLTTSLKLAHERLDKTATELAAQDDLLTVLESHLEALKTTTGSFERRSFRERLRWLVTGR